MKYERLARSKRGLGKWHSLWLGEDHVLAVESTGYSEEYTRYYLKDIQAVSSLQTSWGKVLNAISGSGVAISFGAAISSFGLDHDLSPGTFAGGIIGTIFLLILLWNIFRGPTCRCYIRVPLGSEELAALDRRKSVDKALARLRPQIAQQQGEIDRQEIAAHAKAQQEATSSTNASAAKDHPTAAIAHTSSVTQRIPLHQAAFLLLLTEAGVSILQFFKNSKALTTVSACIIFGLILLLIASLIKQREERIRSLASKLCWGGLATMAAAAMIESVFMMYYGFSQLAKGNMTNTELMDLSATIDPLDHPPLAVFRILYILTICGIGIAGLISQSRASSDSGGRRP